MQPDGHSRAPSAPGRGGASRDAKRARTPRCSDWSQPLSGGQVRIKRAYDPAEPSDGYRVLIDHVWPRGVLRERARVDEWARDLAPSDALRQWFDHEPERYARFRVRYRRELAGHPERIAALRRRAARAPLTVVYAAHDREHNNAVVLAEVLRET